MNNQQDYVSCAPLSISLGFQSIDRIVKILNARKVIVTCEISLQSTLETLITLFTNYVKIVIDHHVLYHLGQVVAAPRCRLEFVSLI